jgi:peptidoglycan/LPS O-acetylase OafA/YrhL
MKADRWLALDGLRALAVLFVCGFHFGAPFATGGYLGVDLFFVISGCVVTTSMLRAIDSQHSLPQFLWRRVARLFPNLLLLLAAALLINLWRDGALATAHNAALLKQLVQIYDFSLEPDIPTPHLWSLSVEWQFYLLLVLLAPIMLACQRRWRWLIPTALGVLSLAAKILWTRNGAMSLLHIYFWPFTRADGFLFGVALALCVQGGRVIRAVAPAALLLLGVVAAMVVAPRWWTEPVISLTYVIPATTVAVVLIVWSLVSRPDSPLGRLLAHPALTWVGARSYSIYLWHYVVGVILIGSITHPQPGWEGPPGEGWRGPAIFGVQLGLTLLVAAAAYAWVEQPARAWLNRVQAPAD